MRRAKDVPASGEPRLGPLAHSIAFHLRLAHDASFQAFARHVRRGELRAARFAVLLLIGQNPGISQTALGRISGRDKSSLTPALDDFEARALIHRRRVARDRRSYALSLTAKGEKILAQLMTHARAHDRLLDRIVERRHKASLIGALRRIAVTLS